MRLVTELGGVTFSIGAWSADIRPKWPLILSGEVIDYRQREVVATRIAIE